MASWGSYVFELCRINANQGLTAEIDWNYTSWSRRCRKILIGLVVRGAKTVVVRGKNRILTRKRKKPEMTVPISFIASWGSYVFELCRINANQGLTAEIDWNYTSWSRRCRKILIGLVVRGAKTVVVRGNILILTGNTKISALTVPIGIPELSV